MYWDSKSTLNVIQPNGQVGAQSAALGLPHELYHWYTKKITGSFDEYLATAYETRAAEFLGEPVRAHYNAIYANNPTAHADNTTASAIGGYWKKVESGQIIRGPEYDPNVEVITTEPSDPRGGGDSGGGYIPPSSGGGGGSTGGGGGGGTGVVTIRPIPEQNPEIVVDPYPSDQDYSAGPIGIVGVPEPIF